MNRTIVVLGGYGNFGRIISQALANEPNAGLLLAGRDLRRAELLARTLQANAGALRVDIERDDLVAVFKSVGAAVVIHSAGPFQGQHYNVARACVEARCHYIDIADSRQFVVGIDALHDEARNRNVLIASGASSVPALSVTVVDRLARSFKQIERIEHAITAGAKPPGVATMRGVLGYVGKPFARYERRKWATAFGWQDLVAWRFPKPVGRRWLAGCDVPDLELLVRRYPDVQSVVFRAGIGFASTTLAVWCMSWLVRAGLMGNAANHAPWLHRVATWLEPLGSTWSAMRVRVTGLDHQGAVLHRQWTLLAGDNHGPNIPCFPAIALARKLLRNEIDTRGAMPCVGLLTVDEILRAIPNLNLRAMDGDWQ